jgi:uncharacterized protein (TIGR00156 family)
MYDTGEVILDIADVSVLPFDGEDESHPSFYDLVAAKTDRGDFKVPFFKEIVMNKKFLTCLVVLTFVGLMVNAQEGYRGPSVNAVTVEAAKGMRDDYPVILRGKIEQFLGDEKYLFADDSGSIVVEIDDKLWRGFSVDQNDVVEITGEVDKGLRKTEIEVSAIKKL